ncbi:MAG TPA: YebC/PmpR family DNA-binding transcriptional regulator [Desulfotomaculum sp.]|nr:MAG: putative transcriptional regulatory protein [Desulfotomaculum sp. 46_80]HAG12149.1 YebC/PmpR family DNA-binding transcriptional regulator [Desulfotomaculum sp.]HBY04791.1 YebC/PmpR family DNA-binding transcriptional regulator [Desulfotomaculum sp.]
MSGHSKWSTIKRKKAKTDSQRGKLFTTVAREIIMAVRQGGADPNHNTRLKAAILKAKEANIPNENIERAIMRGSGTSGEGDYEEIVYEGYGPGGAAIMLNIATSNRNRTAGEIRHLFSRSSGNLGETGCVSWMFERKGLIVIEKEDFNDEEALMTIILDTDAEDMKEEKDSFIITASPGNFEEVKDTLTRQGIPLVIAEITMIPLNTVKLGEAEAEQMSVLINALEEHDDVQEIFTNFDQD